MLPAVSGAQGRSSRVTLFLDILEKNSWCIWFDVVSQHESPAIFLIIAVSRIAGYYMMLHKWWFQQMGVPQHGWCIIVYHGKSECKMDDSGLARYFRTITNYSTSSSSSKKKRGDFPSFLQAQGTIFSTGSRPLMPCARSMWRSFRWPWGDLGPRRGLIWIDGVALWGILWWYLGLSRAFGWFFHDFWMILDDFVMIFG